MPVSRRTAGEHQPPRWQGWWRGQGERQWCVLAEADDYDLAWKRLLDLMPRQSGQAVVLPEGRVP
jgi:hypothetical protein